MYRKVLLILSRIPDNWIGNGMRDARWMFVVLYKHFALLNYRAWSLRWSTWKAQAKRGIIWTPCCYLVFQHTVYCYTPQHTMARIPTAILNVLNDFKLKLPIHSCLIICNWEFILYHWSILYPGNYPAFYRVQLNYRHNMNWMDWSTMKENERCDQLWFYCISSKNPFMPFNCFLRGNHRCCKLQLSFC